MNICHWYPAGSVRLAAAGFGVSVGITGSVCRRVPVGGGDVGEAGSLVGIVVASFPVIIGVTSAEIDPPAGSVALQAEIIRAAIVMSEASFINLLEFNFYLFWSICEHFNNLCIYYFHTTLYSS
jgi:hypothetical protein